MFIYALIALIVGFIPLGSLILVPMEIYMIYTIQHLHGATNIFELITICGAAGTVSLIVKGVATFLHAIPGIGQVANSIVACVFVIALYNVVDEHYQNQTNLPHQNSTSQNSSYSK